MLYPIPCCTLSLIVHCSFWYPVAHCHTLHSVLHCTLSRLVPCPSVLPCPGFTPSHAVLCPMTPTNLHLHDFLVLLQLDLFSPFLSLAYRRTRHIKLTHRPQQLDLAPQTSPQRHGQKNIHCRSIQTLTLFTLF